MRKTNVSGAVFVYFWVWNSIMENLEECNPKSDVPVLEVEQFVI